jgi:hypothetical protein
MRKTIASAAVLLSSCLANTGLAQGAASGVDLAMQAPRRVDTCTITALDSVTMNFVCQTNRRVRQYWVSRSTRFLADRPNVSFFELTTGQPVQVTFHNTGRQRIADIVRF